MTRQLVPLAAVPSQLVSVNLGDQPCQISVRQRSSGMYLSLSIGQTMIVSCKYCADGVRLIPAYAPFVGNLFFVDTRGNNNPEYSGLGDRYQLVYEP